MNDATIPSHEGRTLKQLEAELRQKGLDPAQIARRAMLDALSAESKGAPADTDDQPPAGAQALQYTLVGLLEKVKVAADPGQNATRWYMRELLALCIPSLQAALAAKGDPAASASLLRFATSVHDQLHRNAREIEQLVNDLASIARTSNDPRPAMMERVQATLRTPSPRSEWAPTWYAGQEEVAERSFSAWQFTEEFAAAQAAIRRSDFHGAIRIGFYALQPGRAPVRDVWREVIDEALIVSGLSPIAPQEDPRKALGRLIAWETSVALDPRVSKEAAALMEAGAVPKAAVDAVGNLRHLYRNLVGGSVASAEAASSIATGLLGPAIKALERHVSGAPAAHTHRVGYLSYSADPLDGRMDELHFSVRQEQGWVCVPLVLGEDQVSAPGAPTYAEVVEARVHRTFTGKAT